jgi:hypothetical protein
VCIVDFKRSPTAEASSYAKGRSTLAEIRPEVLPFRESEGATRLSIPVEPPGGTLLQLL